MCEGDEIEFGVNFCCGLGCGFFELSWECCDELVGFWIELC